jgi:hypothetical protein
LVRSYHRKKGRKQKLQDRQLFQDGWMVIWMDGWIWPPKRRRFHPPPLHYIPTSSLHSISVGGKSGWRSRFFSSSSFLWKKKVKSQRKR